MKIGLIFMLSPNWIDNSEELIFVLTLRVIHK